MRLVLLTLTLTGLSLAETCQHTKVAVLGAGMAGIMAAQALSNASVDDFVIVEYNGYLGGRMAHTTLNGLTVELGANWVQGTQSGPNDPENPIWRLAKKWKIKNHLTDYSDVQTFDQDGPADFAHLLDAFNEYYGVVEKRAGTILTENLQDQSFRGGLLEAGWNPKQDMYKQSAEWYQFQWEYNYSPDESSELYTIANYNSSFYQFSEDDYFVVDQRGFNYILRGESSEFLTDDDPRLMLNTIVRKIKWSDSGVTIYANDTCIQADYAICTFSIGVLQNEAVTFSPKLPSWKQAGINTFQMGTYLKIFFQFPHQFWPDSLFSWYADPVQCGYYPVWQNFNHKGYLPGSNIFMVTVVNEMAERVQRQGAAATKRQAMAVLEAMFPNATIPEPTAMLIPQWTTEPWAYGSFSNWPPGTSLEMHQNLRANTGRLHFAGEGTSQNYYGYLQGAYFEGQYIGQKIAACVKGETCEDEAHYETLHGVAPESQYNPTNGWMVSSFETFGY